MMRCPQSPLLDCLHKASAMVEIVINLDVFHKVRRKEIRDDVKVGEM